MRSEQDERVDKLSLSLVLDEEEAHAPPPPHGTLDVSQGMTIWLCLFWSGGRGTVCFLKTIKSF